MIKGIKMYTNMVEMGTSPGTSGTTIGKAIKGATKSLAGDFENNLISDTENLINELLKSTTHMPLISSVSGISTLYNTVKILSYGCTGCIVAYKGVKMLFSPDLIDNKDGKDLLSRFAYSFIFSTLSIKFIDTMINFANTLNEILIKNFSLVSLMPNVKGAGMIIVILMMFLELLVSLKILVEFWMRMAELVFSGVISPVLFVFWINKEWSGFLTNWWKRVMVLIFTQVVQVLLMIVYTAMINGMVLSGSIQSICLSVASLLMIGKAPNILASLTDSTNNVKNAYNSVQSAKKVTTKVSKLFGGK